MILDTIWRLVIEGRQMITKFAVNVNARDSQLYHGFNRFSWESDTNPVRLSTHKLKKKKKKLKIGAVKWFL